MVNTATDTLETNTPKSGGGYTVGQSATDLVGFYGVTPVVQPTAAAQAAVVDTSGGTATEPMTGYWIQVYDPRSGQLVWEAV